MITKLRRRHEEEKGDTRLDEGRVITATVERAQAHIRRMPLAGLRPLHTDETIALWKVKRAITDFFDKDE